MRRGDSVLTALAAIQAAPAIRVRVDRRDPLDRRDPEDLRDPAELILLAAQEERAARVVREVPEVLAAVPG